jgi:hypothetical protein
MSNVVLGLQGGRSNGAEPTFDSQPMQPGMHLRWTVSPELGLPQGCFWLCRRVATPGETQIQPPAIAGQFTPPVSGS